MADLKWILIVGLLTCFLNCSVSTGPEPITVNSGDDVILQCRGPRDANIELLEWTKPDLKTDDYVFFFREEQFYENYQHPFFNGRVELQRPDIKDGDFSVILKNVKLYDTGTYECYVGKSNSGRSKRATPELINSITIQVKLNITAHTGHRVTLPCRVPSDTPITAVEWIRRDLTAAGYAFLYRNGQPDPGNQHPYFKNWVEVKDSEVKHRDASLTLKEAMNVDSGIYECRVNQGGTSRTISIIDLYVEPGHKDEM